jgi:cell wall-associated NlpC family hydrolase
MALAFSPIAPASADSGVKPNAYAHVANTDGDNINLREGADSSYDVKDQVSEGTVVWVLEGPIKDAAGQRWYRIDIEGRVGWIGAAYLAGGKGSTTAAATTSSPAKSTTAATVSDTRGAVPTLKAGGYAAVAYTDGDALRVRKSAASSATVIDTFDPGTVVSVVKGPTKDSDGVTWYQVKNGTSTGWVMGKYLQTAAKPKATPVAKATAKPAAKAAAQPAAAARSGQSRGTSAAPQPPPAASSGASKVVQIGLKYLGYRYRWGGTTPAGFDCSGFVYYVFNQAGVSMSRSMDAQIGSGPHISSSDLRPGDIVYFRNTYRSGLSHIGIYVGNGKFVHAADYDTGVELSDLWSSYWAAHYAGATRVNR